MKNDLRFLDGKKIYLRPLKKSDINDGWLNWINDPDARENLMGYFPVIEKDLKSYFNLQKLPYSAMFAICLKKDNKYIGNIRLSSIDWINKCCAYGRLIGNKGCRGKGYGSEALILILRYGFEVLGMNRMYTSVIKTNKASVKSSLKIGVKKEGILRKASFKQGKFFDRVSLSILAKDFFNKYGKTN